MPNKRGMGRGKETRTERGTGGKKKPPTKLTPQQIARRRIEESARKHRTGAKKTASPKKKGPETNPFKLGGLLRKAAKGKKK